MQLDPVAAAQAVVSLTIAAAILHKSVMRFTVYLPVEKLQLRLAHGLRQSVSLRSCAIDQFSMRSVVFSESDRVRFAETLASDG